MNDYMIIFDKNAYNEFEEIYKYIYKNFGSKIIADRIIDKINRKIPILKIFPFAFQKLEGYSFKEKICRRIIVDNYSIIYYILENEKKVVIVHIFYNKKNFLNL